MEERKSQRVLNGKAFGVRKNPQPTASKIYSNVHDDIRFML